MRPEVFVPPVVGVDNLDTIESFEILSPGKYYVTPPNLLVVNNVTNEVVDDSSLIAEAPNGTISNIIQICLLYTSDAADE